MKENIKIAALITIGLASISAAHASSTDLLLGFNDAAGPSAAQNDYVIDLGLNGNTLIADANGNGGTWNLSSSFNAGTFSTAFSADTAYLNNVAAGVVGGISSPTKTIFQTDLIGNTPAVTFSGAFNNSLSSAQSSTIGEYSSSSGSGWSTYVAIDPNTPGSLSSTTGQRHCRPDGQSAWFPELRLDFPGFVGKYQDRQQHGEWVGGRRHLQHRRPIRHGYFHHHRRT